MCELRSGSGVAEARPGDGSDRPGAQVRERDVLLATKLRVPRSRRDVLVRPRLLDRIEEAAARELLLVSAPAGFGKSTLLTEWARTTTRPVGWASLDSDDNDPVRLWRYVVAAVEQVHPGLEERVLPLLDTPDQPTPEAVVTAVVNELTAGPSEFTVVLDDYHVIESPAIQTGIAFLLERLPPGMHVVIAGRSDPPLPLARMRARGQLAEVRAEDLRFTHEEAVALLREVWGLDLPEQRVALLEERTKGWVTGRSDGQQLLEDLERANLFRLPWTGSAAGTATTACSPTCCGCASGRRGPPSGWPGCTGGPPPGPRAVGWSTMPCGMPWRRGKPAGPPGSWSTASMRSCAWGRERPCGAGFLPCLRRSCALGRLLRAVRPAPAGARPDAQPRTRMAAALVEPYVQRRPHRAGRLESADPLGQIMFLGDQG